MNYLIVVCGPTAVGKTELAIFIAKHFQTEIISADSRQFYNELNIGVAKPTDEQLKKVKHHFINSISVFDDYNVGKFEKDALRVLEEIFLKKNIAVLVGGSGLYIKAVCEGLDEYPDIDKEIREQVKSLYEEKGIVALQEELRKRDKKYFEQVDKENPHRLIRALEVCISTGKPFSSFQFLEKKKRNFIPIKIGLNIKREKLYEKVNQRVDDMFKDGLLEEAKNLFPNKTLNSLQTVGYQELFDCMDKRISMQEATDLIKQHTRNYAKRQITWFNKDKDIRWFQPDEREKILKYLRSKIK